MAIAFLRVTFISHFSSVANNQAELLYQLEPTVYLTGWWIMGGKYLHQIIINS